jgi:hypothetical protein
MNAYDELMFQYGAVKAYYGSVDNKDPQSGRVTHSPNHDFTYYFDENDVEVGYTSPLSRFSNIHNILDTRGREWSEAALNIVKQFPVNTFMNDVKYLQGL